MAIPDRETFETLAFTDSSGTSFLKFILLGMDTDRPRLYFQNTKRFQHHGHFLNAVGLPIDRAVSPVLSSMTRNSLPPMAA